MIKEHQMEPAIPSIKKQRKPRKDKGKPKLTTAGKLIGVSETIVEKDDNESEVTDNTVQEYFKDIISTFHEELCYN